MKIGFEKQIKNIEEDFYRDNLGRAVNLFSDGTTISGDLVAVNEQSGRITLKNYIERRYNSDGTSQFWENPGKFELSAIKIWGKSSTTREDRLGRIANYNRDLSMQELEQNEKLRRLSEPPLNCSS